MRFDPAIHTHCNPRQPDTEDVGSQPSSMDQHSTQTHDWTSHQELVSTAHSYMIASLQRLQVLHAHKRWQMHALRPTGRLTKESTRVIVTCTLPCAHITEPASQQAAMIHHH